MAILTQYMTPTLTAALQVLLLALVAFATNWVHQHTKNAMVTAAVDRASADLQALVARAAQKIDTMRNDAGVLSPDVALAVKDQVTAEFSALRGPAGINKLRDLLGLDDQAIKDWISSHIEFAVRTDKKQVIAAVAGNPPVVPPQPTPEHPAS